MNGCIPPVKKRIICSFISNVITSATTLFHIVRRCYRQSSGHRAEEFDQKSKEIFLRLIIPRNRQPALRNFLYLHKPFGVSSYSLSCWKGGFLVASNDGGPTSSSCLYFSSPILLASMVLPLWMSHRHVLQPM